MKRLAEIRARIEELEGIITRGEANDDTLKEIKELRAEADALVKAEEEALENLRSVQGLKIPEVKRNEVTPTQEYRQAFRDFFSGKRSNLNDFAEFRATTAVGDVGSIIPDTIVNKIISKMETYGNIFNKVTRTALKGGVSQPIADVILSASWVAEGATATEQKWATGEITFGYHKVQVKVGITLMAETVSLDIWETAVAEKMAIAIVVALEKAITTGTGTLQPTGILADTNIPAAHIVDFDLSVAANATWQGWNDGIFAKTPDAFDALPDENREWLCNKATFYKYMRGLVDSNGQPLVVEDRDANGKPIKLFMGYPVTFRTEIPSFDAADAGAKYLIFGDLRNYVINSNMEMTTRSYIDEDTDKIVRKTTMLADGKVANKYAFFIAKKPAA